MPSIQSVICASGPAEHHGQQGHAHVHPKFCLPEVGGSRVRVHLHTSRRRGRVGERGRAEEEKGRRGGEGGRERRGRERRRDEREEGEEGENEWRGEGGGKEVTL